VLSKTRARDFEGFDARGMAVVPGEAVEYSLMP